MANAQDGQKGEPAAKNMRCMRPAFYMAQEMGARLGQRQILLGSVPRWEGLNIGAPGRTRTCCLKIRSLALYPDELRARAGNFVSADCIKTKLR